jgi:hypothetical protein
MRSTFRRARSLREDEVRALWRLRLQLIDLKPTVSPEQDFEAFAKDFQWPGWVWIGWDGDRVGGFFLQRGVPVTWRGRELLCLLPEYGFVAPHLRGGAVLPVAAVVITALSAARHPLRPKYVAASTYPPGYIAFRRAVSPFWTLSDPALPDWERSLLLHLGERVSGVSFRPSTGTVTMRTVPFAGRSPRGEDGRALFAAYEGANPEWREGVGLFFLFPVSAGSLAKVVLHAAERAAPRPIVSAWRGAVAASRRWAAGARSG